MILDRIKVVEGIHVGRLLYEVMLDVELAVASSVVKICHYVWIVRRNHRGSGLEGLSAQMCNTNKI